MTTIPILASSSAAKRLLEDVDRLAPLIAAETDEMDAAGRLSPTVVAAVKATGVFRMAQPRDYGGFELTPMEQIGVIESLAAQDASIGWGAMIGSDGGYYGSFVDPEVAAWMDDGLFAREAIGAFPPLVASLGDLRQLLPRRTFDQLVAEVSDQLAA